MAAPDISSILALLPDLLFLSDVASYVLGTLFFGSVALRGLRGSFSFLPRMAIRVVSGLGCMLAGITIQPYFQFAASGLYGLLHIDLFLASLTCAGVLAIALYLVTFRLYNIPGLERRLKQLQETIKKAKQMPKETHGWSDPVKLVGVGIILAMAALVVLTFHGFPRPSEDLLTSIGLNGQLGNQNCPGPLAVISAVGTTIDSAPTSTHAIGTQMEKQSGGKLQTLRTVTYQGNPTYVGILNNGVICTGTATSVCGCVESGGGAAV